MADSIDTDALATAEAQVLAATRALVDGRALSLSQHGNISTRVAGADAFVLTGGSTLDRLARHDLALIDLDGRTLRGSLTPTVDEIIQMHAAIYRARGDVGAVIHTHSPHITAFAIAGRPIPPVYEPMVRLDVTEPVPVADYGPRGSERSVSNILDVLGPRTKSVLLANHGVLVFDRDLDRAVRLVFVLEEAAEFTLKADLLGGARPIPQDLMAQALQRRDTFAQRAERGEAGQ